jgi:hypothetical protein
MMAIKIDALPQLPPEGLTIRQAFPEWRMAIHSQSLISVACALHKEPAWLTSKYFIGAIGSSSSPVQELRASLTLRSGISTAWCWLNHPHHHQISFVHPSKH